MVYYTVVVFSSNTGSLAADVSEAALESFQDCIEVLEESVQRNERSLAFNSTVNTYNASVVKLD